MVRITQGLDMNFLYHTGKAYVVADALSRLSMGSTSPFEEEKRDYSKAVQTSTHRSQTFGFHRRRDSGEQRV